MTAALVERNRARVGQARSGSRSRPKLKVLNQQAIRQRARRRYFLVSLFIVVLLGFFAVAFVHAGLVADQQELDGIRARITEAEAHNAKVARLTEEASSPQAIVARATELGMVRAHQPVYLAASAPLRDVPTAVSFRTAERAVAEGVAAPANSETSVSVGICGVATVPTTPASPTVAAPAIEPDTVTLAANEPQTENEPQVENIVVGSTAAVTGTTESPQPAAPSPAANQAPASQVPTSIAGSSAETGSGTASTGATEQVTGQIDQEQPTSRFGGLNVGTGSG